MKKKIETLSSALMIAVFLGFTAGLGILSAYGVATNYTTYSYYENRNLAEFPQVEKETILNGSFFTKVDDWCRDHAAKRNGVLTYHTLLNMNVLKRPVVNETVIAGDILLPYNSPETVDQDRINDLAAVVGENLRSHARLCESYGGKFYYVAVPCQYVYYEDRYPWYLNSRKAYTEASSAALFSELDRVGVTYIDMRKDFEEQGHRPEYSSTIDNHYSIFGALETYRVLMNRVNGDTGWNLRVMGEEDYTVTTLPNPYIGSRVRKLLGLWESEERLSVITPREEIPFTRWDWGRDTPSASSVYSLPETETEGVLYPLYMGGDNSITKIETNRPELPTILVYGDSFTNALESLIWYNFDTMYSLDFRHYKDKTLEEFIAEVKPDVVVCVRDYEQLIAPSGNGQ